MNIELIVQDSQNGTIYDMSEIASDISWVTELVGQPGKFTFKYESIDNLVVNEGSVVSFKVDSVGVFYGYIFKREKNENNVVTVTAYDQMRYLKNQDTYVFSGVTASQIFEKICKDFELKHRFADLSTYVLSDRVYDNKKLSEIIEWAIDETLAYTGNWFMIRDDFGTLEFINLNNLKTNLFIGDESLLISFKHTTSIDDDTFNYVKLVKENKSTNKREVWVVKDSSTINKWGRLQYFEKMDEEANEAQIKERADQLLKLKNRVSKTFKVDCIGDLRVFAGIGVVVGIQDLAEMGLTTNKYYLVNSCTHKFSNNDHTMSLDLKVI